MHFNTSDKKHVLITGNLWELHNLGKKNYFSIPQIANMYYFPLKHGE